MSGINGFINLTKDISNMKDTIKQMNNKLKRNNANPDGYYFEKHAILNCNNSITTLNSKEKQPITLMYNNCTYTITCNGNIYNKDELKEELLKNGFNFENDSDAEILLKGYICWGYEIVKKLNGVFGFAIWNSSKQELFFVRDHFGIKPFYYTILNNTFIFSSEIKAILEFPGVEPILDEQGICELLGLGPAHTPGVVALKNIFELKPAHFGIYNTNGLHIEKYWSLTSKPHHDNLKNTCEKTKFLLEDSINKQLITDKSLCTFLSGGLDSSIITLYASNYYQNKKSDILTTFSVDYKDNDKNFVKTDFQPNSDNYYIDIMKKELNTNHNVIMLDTPELAESLEAAMVARDLPGMADVDSSLLLFCERVKPYACISLTGECSDEIFGGYPWFFREDALNSKTFPWSIALDERQKLLNNSINSKINLKDYINFRYTESLNEVEIIDEDSMETAQKRKISHLTLNWFMQTLLDRSDRMASYNEFEIRVPFCDYRLAEYVWNIPWEMKALNGREKGLLRYIMKDVLPEEIVDRKKSPYPKTWNPTYLYAVKHKLTKIMEDKNAPINNLLNRDYILEILETNGKSFTRPWFGQLMTGPQLMAYLCQVNMWLEKYQPKIEIK